METKTQLTAVEWFNQQLVDRQNGNGDSRSRDEIFEQAKEMEKEQKCYTEHEVLQLLLKLQQTESYDNLYDWFQQNKKPLNQNKMEKTQEKKEIKAENLVDDFVKQWRVKNNTINAVYAAYHYDAMIAFAEYFKEISKSEHKMKIVHLINDTYQAVSEDETTVYFQGSEEECERYIVNILLNYL